MRFNPKVSIVIPVYNGSNYLREAIDSALAQSYDNVEVIVVNDGSCDGGKTEAIAISYGEKIRYFAKNNGGVASALNQGIREMTGEYFSWLSHDDLYLPNKVKRQVSIMGRQTTKRTIVYSDFEGLDVSRDRLHNKAISHIAPYNYLQDMLQLLFRSALHGCTLLIPRSGFAEIGFFDEELRTTQDYDLWFKFLKQGFEFVHLPEVLVRARWHLEQGTHTLSAIHLTELDNLYRWITDQFGEEIMTFPAEQMLSLVVHLRRRTLKASADYMLDMIRRTNSELYSALRIRLLPATVIDKSKSLLMKAAIFTFALIPRCVKDLVDYLIDRFFFFIKIDTVNQNTRRVVFVVLPESLHTARWINQFSGQGWDLHVFPALDTGKVHPDLRSVTIYYSIFGNVGKNHKSGNRYRGIYLPTAVGVIVAMLVRIVLQRLYPSYRVHQLSRLIRRLKPDVVHSMEFQVAGYLTLKAREEIGKSFPKWIATNWGNDIFLFGKLQQHLPIIRRLLECCDFYSCECNRDVGLARDFGFKGVILPVFPNAGGYDLSLAKRLQQPGPVADRRLIMLKGYGFERGRAVCALRALERCADLLKEKNYRVVIYLATNDVVFAAELFASETDIDVKIYPFSAETGRQHYALNHEEILGLHGQARISINNNIADGIAISLLDAMVMGSFPIHSCGACGDDWFENGISGLIVPANDPEEIEAAIRKALTDDDMINQAAVLNWKTACERLEYKALAEQTMQFYSRVFSVSDKT